MNLTRQSALILEAFRGEGAARGDTTTVQTPSIVDDKPQAQYLYPQCVLYRNPLERAELRVLVVR